jgi:hypothetical protein
MVDVLESQGVTFAEFCDEWLREFREGDFSPLDKGRLFAFKLVTQWLDVTEDDEDLELCDGSGDGGIDVAYLHREDADDENQDDQSAKGHTWYLIQSKYGTSFQGSETIMKDGHKVITTLAGENSNLSANVRQLVGRLHTFMQQASDSDRVVLVFATEQPMSEADRVALRDILSIGRERISPFFDVEDISLQTIFEDRDQTRRLRISLPISGDFIDPSSGIRVGAIPLPCMYEFLSAYRNKTGNLDQLYEKNVRQFLGSRRRINKGIAETLRNSPHLFGLYNNGITIVVSEYSIKPDGSCVLFDPYIVNGCQTTRTIWNEMRQKFDAGGTGKSAGTEDWRSLAEIGVVVAKIIKGDNAQITDITRFTNSQNAVQERDFIALRSDFRSWASIMADSYGIFLEIQRGGWDAQRAFQKAHPTSKQFSQFANAFDLLKVYGAGWLRVPGTAYSKNAAFAPGGSVFKRVTSGDEPFGPQDLYAAYRLKEESDQFKFGRNRELQSRGQTRYLFYYVVLEFLRDTLVRAQRPSTNGDITEAFLELFREENRDALQGLLEASVEVIDEYLNPESEDSVFKEPNFQDSLNLFMNMEQLGTNENFAPLLKSLLEAHKRLFGRGYRDQLSPRELVSKSIHGGDI